MVLESTMICVDNSDFMRNGDFVPTRLQSQQDAVNLVCHSKTRANPENNIGLITLAERVQVLATLTSDMGRIITKLHLIQPSGQINFPTGLRIAHLALKHRQGKNHKMRIVAFVGSPVLNDEKDLVKLAKRLKKEKVNVDIVSFGEDSLNAPVLSAFINALNGKDGTSSHLITIPPGPHLSDALITSAVIQGEDGTGAAGLGGAGFEYGVDPNEDPELALALRVSMEEQRARQENETRQTQGPDQTAQTLTPNEEAILERALAMSMETEPAPSTSQASSSPARPDFGSMTEEEQIEFAMRMSMQDAFSQESSGEEKKDKPKTEPMDVDYHGSIPDADFLKSVLESLPGVESQIEPTGGASSSSKDKDKSVDEKDKTKDEKDDKDEKDKTKQEKDK